MNVCPILAKVETSKQALALSVPDRLNDQRELLIMRSTAAGKNVQIEVLRIETMYHCIAEELFLTEELTALLTDMYSALRKCFPYGVFLLHWQHNPEEDSEPVLIVGITRTDFSEAYELLGKFEEDWLFPNCLRTATRIAIRVYE